LPYLSDEYQPKSEKSKTPIYHHMGIALRRMKRIATSKRFSL